MIPGDTLPGLLPAVLSGITAGLLMGQFARPPRRLHSRLRHYTSPTPPLLEGPSVRSPLQSVFGPMLTDLANWLGALVDRSPEASIVGRLRQAGWFKGQAEESAVASYRLLQMRTLGLALIAGVVGGQALGLSMMLRLVLVGLAVVAGATRTRGRLERAIEVRRERMRIEIYTINQLLAMRVRAGGGVVQAVKSIVRRGRGEVVGELEDALRLHRAGWSGSDAFRRIAELTPEPLCARTYRLLAAAEERGADLAKALLSLSEDARETRRESIKRTATKRRAAMLVPTIAILAPVLILFVAAPLPYLITSWQ